MNTEERYINYCYGNASDMILYYVEKDGETLELHTTKELTAFLQDGWKRVDKPAPADSETCTGEADYALALAEHDAIEAECEAASKHLKAVSGKEKGPMGLTPDHIKATPEWKLANAAYYAATRKLQRFNQGFLKQHKREWQATLLSRRQARVPASPSWLTPPVGVSGQTLEA